MNTRLTSQGQYQVAILDLRTDFLIDLLLSYLAGATTFKTDGEISSDKSVTKKKVFKVSHPF